MRLLLHKGRHVCVAPELDESVTSLSDDEKVTVLWVGLAPSVEGVARRGRPPAHKDAPKAFPASEFSLLDHGEAGEDLLRTAKKAVEEKFAQAASSDDSESETETVDDSSDDDVVEDDSSED